MAFSLDDIRAAVEKEYGATKIDLGGGEILELRNLLRLSKEERKAIQAINLSRPDEETEQEDDDYDQIEEFEKLLVLVAKDKRLVNKLLDEIEHDPAFIAEIVVRYTQEQKLGKAQKSADGSTSTDEDSSETSESSTS